MAAKTWHLAHQTDSVDLVLGPQKDMDVFRHDHIGPQQEMAMATSFVHSIKKPLSASILAQERKPPKARKREFVRLAGSVVALILPAVANGHDRFPRLRMLS